MKYLLILLTFTCSLSLAESTNSWKVTTTERYKNIYTTYVDGSEFGITCKEVCFYYLVPPKNCNEGTQDASLIINSSGNTVLVANKCVKHEDVHFFMFDSYEDITELVKDDEIIQFIFNLNKNKKNSVSTYSLKGFKLVIDEYLSSVTPK